MTFALNQVVSQNVLREAVPGVATWVPHTNNSFRQMLNASTRPVRGARVRVAFPKLRIDSLTDVSGVHACSSSSGGK